MIVSVAFFSLFYCVGFVVSVPRGGFSPLSAASSSPPDSQTVQEMHTVLQRRLDFIIASVTQASQIATWQVNYLILLHHTLSPDLCLPGYRH